MGFLNKKPSIKLPKGEISRTASKSSAGMTSTPGGNSSRTVDEEREDTTASSGLWTDVESRVAGAQSVTQSRASRGRAESSSSLPSKEPRVKRKTSAASAPDKQGRGRRSQSPMKLGIKKTPNKTEKKKREPRQRQRSRSVSADRGRRRSPVTPKHKRGSKEMAEKGKKSTGPKELDRKKKAGGKGHRDRSRSTSKEKKRPNPKDKKARTPPKAEAGRRKAAAASEATPKVTNGKSKEKKMLRARSASLEKGKSKSHSRSPVRNPFAKGAKSSSRGDRPPVTARSEKTRRRLSQELSEEETSFSGSGSDDDYSDDDDDLSSYYSDTETDAEDTTMYTDASEFVSIGYNSTDDTGDDHPSDSEGSSAASEEGGTGRGAASYKSEERKAAGSPSKVKGALAMLGSLAVAKKADRKEAKDDRKKREPSSPSPTAKKSNSGDKGGGDDYGETNDVVPSGSDATERDDGDDAPSASGRHSKAEGSRATSATTSTYADFMRKMADFMAKDPDHQLMVQVTEHGNVEKLQLQELATIPKATRANEIVVKVECSTITLQDCMIRRGKWYEMQSLPFVPGSDVVGTIFSMGDEATRCSTFQEGDKVAAVVPSGGNAKYVTLPYQKIIRVPPQADPVIALCLCSTYVPAREALDLGRKLNTPLTGANVLVVGGNGPSGLAAIELALLEGANVYATADERHHEHLGSIGARCFPIDPAKWLPTLRGKMDVVLDSVCLDGYESSSLALNSAGTLVCTGMSAVYTQGQIRAFGMRDVRDYKAVYCRMRARYMLSNAVYYDRMERYDNAPNEYAQHFRYLCHLASKDSVRPLVSTRTPLNMVAGVQKAIEHGDTTYGVCVCMPWLTGPGDGAEEGKEEEEEDGGGAGSSPAEAAAAAQD